jgi:hypothetical protein
MQDQNMTDDSDQDDSVSTDGSDGLPADVDYIPAEEEGQMQEVEEYEESMDSEETPENLGIDEDAIEDDGLDWEE